MPETVRYSASVKLSSTSPQTDHRALTVYADTLLERPLIFEKMSSIGLKFGLYGGT